jgi:predicted RNase H-like HicB family nuclease
MVARRFKVLIEWDPEAQVWVTYVPVLDHLSTYGETREEALENTREAILGYLEAAAKEGIPVPPTDPEIDLIALEVPRPARQWHSSCSPSVGP